MKTSNLTTSTKDALKESCFPHHATIHSLPRIEFHFRHFFTSSRRCSGIKRLLHEGAKKKICNLERSACILPRAAYFVRAHSCVTKTFSFFFCSCECELNWKLLRARTSYKFLASTLQITVDTGIKSFWLAMVGTVMTKFYFKCFTVYFFNSSQTYTIFFILSGVAESTNLK